MFSTEGSQEISVALYFFGETAVSTPLFSLLLGVAVAVGAFLTQELVRFVVVGILFRRRLTADIRIVVSNFRSWAPPAEVAFA